MNNKQFLIILIVTFITVIVWVVLDIVQSRNTVGPAPEIQQLLKPISPIFDTSGLNQ